MKRRYFLGTLLGTISIAALGGCSLFDRHYTYRYRMTVEVVTPDGLKTGSSVQEQTVTKYAVPQLGSGNVRYIDTRGEAVAVDLPGGRTLFALLADSNLIQSVLDPAWTNDWVASAQRITSGETPRTSLSMSAHSAKPFGMKTGYPLLVAFRDIGDPKTVEKITPDDFAKNFGPGVTLKRITVQITDDPVTSGIERRLDDKFWRHWGLMHKTEMSKSGGIMKNPYFQSLAGQLSRDDFTKEPAQ